MFRALLLLLLLAPVACASADEFSDDGPCYVMVKESRTASCATPQDPECTKQWHADVCAPCDDRDGKGCWVGEEFRRCRVSCSHHP